MLTIKTKNESGEYQLNIPTCLSDITTDYLKDVTSEIVIAPEYSIIGLVYKEKLSNIILASRRNQKDTNISVIPIYIKSGETYSTLINNNNINIKDKLIISSSDIMLGYHISTPKNLISINNILNLISTDANIYKDPYKYNTICYFIEFKLVPNCNIHGFYKQNNISFENPYVVTLKDNNDIKCEE